MRYTRLFGLVSILGLGPQVVCAQERMALPITGSFIYNALIYNRVEEGGDRGGALRFAGRIAGRVSPATYLGFGAGSWVRETIPSCEVYPECHDMIAAHSEAVVYQAYIQHYVGRRVVFFRGGAGLANTTTLLPAQFPFFEARRHWRAAVSMGAGIDVRLAKLFYLTPSFDVTILPGADTGNEELGTGFAIGIALTLR